MAGSDRECKHRLSPLKKKDATDCGFMHALMGQAVMTNSFRIAELPSVTPHICLYTYLVRLRESLFNHCQCNICRLRDGQGTTSHRLHELLWVIYLCFFPIGLTTGIEIWVFIHVVLYEAVFTITRPGTTREWTMDPMREVREEVSLQLLPPFKIPLAIRARMFLEGGLRFGLGDWILGQLERD